MAGHRSHWKLPDNKTQQLSGFQPCALLNVPAVQCPPRHHRMYTQSQILKALRSTYGYGSRLESSFICTFCTLKTYCLIKSILGTLPSGGFNYWKRGWQHLQILPHSQNRVEIKQQEITLLVTAPSFLPHNKWPKLFEVFLRLCSKIYPPHGSNSPDPASPVFSLASLK